jgi:pimeloyl-ACP methyl ester carboxylesterase
MVNLNATLQAYIPLGDPKHLCNKDLKVPISFIYGEYDWVQIFEGEVAWNICSTNQFTGDATPETSGLNVSKVHRIPSSDHAMHLDNPDALAC